MINIHYPIYLRCILPNTAPKIFEKYVVCRKPPTSNNLSRATLFATQDEVLPVGGFTVFTFTPNNSALFTFTPNKTYTVHI